MPANPEKDPQATPTPPPATAPDKKREADELSDEDLDKVSGGFAVAPGKIPRGANPLL